MNATQEEWEQVVAVHARFARAPNASSNVASAAAAATISGRLDFGALDERSQLIVCPSTAFAAVAAHTDAPLNAPAASSLLLHGPNPLARWPDVSFRDFSNIIKSADSTAAATFGIIAVCVSVCEPRVLANKDRSSVFTTHSFTLVQAVRDGHSTVTASPCLRLSVYASTAQGIHPGCCIAVSSVRWRWGELQLAPDAILLSFTLPQLQAALPFVRTRVELHERLEVAAQLMGDAGQPLSAAVAQPAERVCARVEDLTDARAGDCVSVVAVVKSVYTYTQRTDTYSCNGVVLPRITVVLSMQKDLTSHVDVELCVWSYRDAVGAAQRVSGAAEELKGAFVRVHPVLVAVNARTGSMLLHSMRDTRIEHEGDAAREALRQIAPVDAGTDVDPRAAVMLRAYLMLHDSLTGDSAQWPLVLAAGCEVRGVVRSIWWPHTRTGVVDSHGTTDTHADACLCKHVAAACVGMTASNCSIFATVCGTCGGECTPSALGIRSCRVCLPRAVTASAEWTYAPALACLHPEGPAGASPALVLLTPPAMAAVCGIELKQLSAILAARPGSPCRPCSDATVQLEDVLTAACSVAVHARTVLRVHVHAVVCSLGSRIVLQVADACQVAEASHACSVNAVDAVTE